LAIAVSPSHATLPKIPLHDQRFAADPGAAETEAIGTRRGETC